MSNWNLDTKKLDNIIKKTVEAIDNSKQEIYGIAENARKECKTLEEELILLKQQVTELIENVTDIEGKLKESKKRLMDVNKNHIKYTQEEHKRAYENADTLRIELAIKREKEQYLIKRRNDLELRLKESYKTVERADNLISHVGVALGFLSGDLRELSIKLDDMQEKQLLGLRILKAQEDERKRVAREIHDGPAQSMSNVVLKAEICEKLIDVDLIKAKGELQNLKKIVRNSLHDVRKIIYNLRPMSLDDLGLIPTLQRHATTFQDETGILVTFRTKGVFETVKPLISLTVFRIVQEAINNVFKHANAQNVVIVLEFSNDQIKLFIYDDGNGFDIEEFNARNKDMDSGFGLLSIKERLELLDGEFDFFSEIGKGTRMNITIPLVQEEGATNEDD